MLFLYFFLQILLHESGTLLDNFETQDYRKYVSDTLVEPMIILWTVILGSVFFSGYTDVKKGEHFYSVRIVEKHEETSF